MNFNDVLSMFQMPLVQRALLVGILVSLCAALLGVVLVLKKYSLIGHGLADVGFAALSFAVAFNLNPLYIAMPVVTVSSFIIMAVSQKKGIQGDIAIGVASTASLALGVIITALTKGFNIDVYDYMFGSILAVNSYDVVLSLIVSVIVLSLFILLYNRIFIITCDEQFAKASGINVVFYQFLISFLTALTVVIGMRMMGTLLISSLIIFPAISAKNIAGSFKTLVVISAVISIICFIAGIFISFSVNMPTGACIVAVNVVIMAITAIIGKFLKFNAA